MQTYN